MPIDTEAVYDAYQDVRSDDTESSWAAFGYDGNTIVHIQTGSDYDEFLALCTDDQRLYGFIRVTTGDEMSKRAKFVLVTFIGDSVGVLKKARVSTDKSQVKQIIQNFSKEIMASNKHEAAYSILENEVKKAGGANYGTGQ